MVSHLLMFNNPKLYTPPPMVRSQFTVSLSMLNPGPSMLNPGPPMANPCMPSLELCTLLILISPDLSMQHHSKSQATVSSTPIRLSVHNPTVRPTPTLVRPTPTLLDKPLVPTVSLLPINQQRFNPLDTTSLVVLLAKSKRPLQLIRKKLSPRHLRFPRFQPLMTIMPSQPLLSFLATVLSQLFLKRPLSKVATVRHQLSLRFPLTQDLANAPVMASHKLTLPNNHLSLKREAAATAHSEASVAAMVAPATVVPRAASVQEVASVLPSLATAAKATANLREDSANPEVDTVASVLPRAATAANPRAATVPSELP